MEAEKALYSVQASRSAMRQAVRAHRGHFYLWLFVLSGSAASVAIGIYQSRQIRTRIDKHFLAALGCILVFGLLSPLTLGGSDGPDAGIRYFGFFALLVMQAYVLAGIWFDNYLLVIGLIVSALILTGLFVFPGSFWLWFAIFCGGPVFLSGFVVRYLWR